MRPTRWVLASVLGLTVLTWLGAVDVDVAPRQRVEGPVVEQRSVVREPVVELPVPPPPSDPSDPADRRDPVEATTTLEIPYRIELATDDPAVADAREVIPSVLDDPRGWRRADIDFVQTPDAEHVIVLAEGPDAQQRCQPYDVGGEFSCQIGPQVVLNATRWREGVSHWPGEGPEALATYRTMLINHEVGHLIGMHHLRCTAPGAPAPVMEQQSGTLRGCLANPWPTDVEVRLAATHQFEVAPGPLEVPHAP